MRLIEGQQNEKKKHLLRLLEIGTVMMFIDSRREDVLVPENHKNNAQLPLNLDYRFDIPDLEITDEKISVSLSFNQVKHYCEIPLPAVYALRCEDAEEVVIFLEELPQKLYAVLPEDQKEEKTIKQEIDPLPSHIKPKPHLVSIESTESTDSGKENSPKKTTKPHLRLVKSED